ncbi:MAG: hypothetical protein AAGD32_07205 [Planctomycetota bacterium]
MTPIYASMVRRTGATPVPIVSVHGTDGDARHEASEAKRFAHLIPFDALFICPQFRTPYQFLLPDADRKVLDFIDGELGVSSRMLIRGFSGGAQFAHRFAFRHPYRVAACSALGAGSYTLPDGTLIGMMVEDDYFTRPEFADPAIRAAGEQPACNGWQPIRWQTGCGRRDVESRVKSAKAFADALRVDGASVEQVTWDAEHDPAPVAERVWRFLGKGVA